MTVRAEAQIDLARVDDGSPGAPGTNGTTFTPSVAADGDISWTNDGGLPNPPTQNIMGPQGDPGTPGSAGVSVTAVEPQYYLSTSDASATGGSWSSTPQAFVSGKYYWTRDYITFSDGTHDTSTEVYNAGMTKAAQDALDAKTLADDTNQYFWYAPTGDDTGTHITEVPQDEWSDNTDPNYHSGGNLLARSNGIAVRDGLRELAIFGQISRVGEPSGSNIEMSPDMLSIWTDEHIKAFQVDTSSVTETTKVSVSNSIKCSPSSTSTIRFFGNYSDVPTGQELHLSVISYGQKNTPDYSTGAGTFTDYDFVFYKGTDKSETVPFDFIDGNDYPTDPTDIVSKNVTITYNSTEEKITVVTPYYFPYSGTHSTTYYSMAVMAEPVYGYLTTHVPQIVCNGITMFDGSVGIDVPTYSNANNVYYGTSNSRDSTGIIVNTVNNDFELTQNNVLYLYSAYINPETTATTKLNVDGLGGVEAYYNGSPVNVNNGKWSVSDIVVFYYDGTYFQEIGTTTYKHNALFNALALRKWLKAVIV